MEQQCKLYFIPEKGEFLKIMPGSGDNLSPEDIAVGYTDYVIWNRFKPECLDIDGDLPMECLDSGMVMLVDPVAPAELQDDATNSALRLGDDDILKRVLEFAYPSAKITVQSLVQLLRA